MAKRYRYILSGGVEPDESISGYRLLDKQKIAGFSDAIRVEIPKDAKLEKWSCDEYSSWDTYKNNSNPSLKELNPCLCIKINSEWKVCKEATDLWLDGTKLEDSIKSVTCKYYPVPLGNIGYVTNEQMSWYNTDNMVSWRFNKIPSDLSNIVVPDLTKEQLDTLKFIRKEFPNYVDNLVDDSIIIDDSRKNEIKTYFANLDMISDIELAYFWHLASATSLDRTHTFETVDLIEKLKRSKVIYVNALHYKLMFEKLLNNMYGIYIYKERRGK